MSSILISSLWPCYARDAANGGLEDCPAVAGYEDIAASIGCSSNRRIPSRKFSRRVPASPAPCRSCGQAPAVLEPRRASGPRRAHRVVSSFTHEVMYAALWDFLQDFQTRGLAAWEAFQASRQGRPYPHPLRLDVGRNRRHAARLEERYLSPSGLAGQRRPGAVAPRHNKGGEGMARNGYQIFDADTHVGPAAEILARYLTAQEQATLTSWELYKAVQRRTGHVTYTRGACLSPSPGARRHRRCGQYRLYGWFYGGA